jgi:hypothetical protein
MDAVRDLSNTCGMLWLIRITGRPRSRTSRMSCSTRLPSLTPRAALGFVEDDHLAAERRRARHRNTPALAARQARHGLADVLQGGDAEVDLALVRISAPDRALIMLDLPAPLSPVTRQHRLEQRRRLRAALDAGLGGDHGDHDGVPRAG